MFQVQTIDNNLGCKASLLRFPDRIARLLIESTSVDLSDADAAVESFRKELAQLSLTKLGVEVDKDQNKLIVICSFRLPWFLKTRKIVQVGSVVFDSYSTHFTPLMKMREDAFFGQLIWDQRCWTTKTEIDGESIPLSIRDWGERDVSETIEDAKELIENWEQWRSKIEEAQIRDLLNLYNNTWEDDDSRRVSSTELHKRLSIAAIDCEDSGWRRIYYDHDDLFTDHTIEMRISPDGDVEAVVAG